MPPFYVGFGKFYIFGGLPITTHDAAPCLIIVIMDTRNIKLGSNKWIMAFSALLPRLQSDLNAHGLASNISAEMRSGKYIEDGIMVSQHNVKSSSCSKMCGFTVLTQLL